MLYDGIIPSISLGIENGLNPCAIANVLIFLMILLHMQHSARSIKYFSLFFVFSAICVYFSLIFGAYDQFIVSESVSKFIRWFYIVLGVIFLSIGYLNILDWIKLKRNEKIEDTLVQEPKFISRVLAGLAKFMMFHERRNFAWVVFVQFIITSIMVSLLLVFGSVWARDYHSFVLFYRMSKDGDYVMAFSSVVLYSLVSVVPFLIVWLLVEKRSKADGILSSIGGPSAVSKALVSAIFLSVGSGLLYIFLK